MTDNLHTWLNERETIHGNATEGLWEAHEATVATAWSGAADWSGPIDDREPVANAAPEDTAAIVDAHNTLPKLLAGVRAVLELHAPVENKYEEHPVCGYCHDDAGPHVLYPCPTIEALQEAINDDE